MWRAKDVVTRAAAVAGGACVLMGALSGAIGGCAAREGPATFRVAEGEYDRAFVATREVLREVNFEIERVDATRGVITTRARPDAGFFTPWTGYQLDSDSAVEGSLNQQRRRVRVTFVPVADEAAYTGGGGDQDRVGSQLDEVASRGPWTAYVDVGVTRMQTVGLRPPPRSVLMSTVSVDPITQAQGIATIYEVPVSQDTSMAAALSERIRKRLGIEVASGEAAKPQLAVQQDGSADAPKPAPQRQPESVADPLQAPEQAGQLKPREVEPAPAEPVLVPVPPR